MYIYVFISERLSRYLHMYKESIHSMTGLAPTMHRNSEKLMTPSPCRIRYRASPSHRLLADGLIQHGCRQVRDDHLTGKDWHKYTLGKR